MGMPHSHPPSGSEFQSVCAGARDDLDLFKNFINMTYRPVSHNGLDLVGCLSPSIGSCLNRKGICLSHYLTARAFVICSFLKTLLLEP